MNQHLRATGTYASFLHPSHVAHPKHLVGVLIPPLPQIFPQNKSKHYTKAKAIPFYFGVSGRKKRFFLFWIYWNQWFKVDVSKQSLFTSWAQLVLYRESMALIRNKFRCMDPWQGKVKLNSSIDNIETDTIFIHRILISCQYQHGLLSLYTYSWFLVSIYMDSYLYTHVRHFLLVSGLLPLYTCPWFFLSVSSWAPDPPCWWPIRNSSRKSASRISPRLPIDM